MIFAVVPAGGRSTRMGRPKLSLPVGDRTVLELVLTALRDGGVEHTVVVIGPHVPELIALADGAGAHALWLRKETPDMRATVEHGLNWLEDRFHPSVDDSWLLVPADHPTLDSAVVKQLLEARTEYRGLSIFIPTYQGRRGHPTLIGWKHVPAIAALPQGQGLNAYLRQQKADTFEVPVTSAQVVADLDTPEDYERLLGGDGA